MYIFAVQRSIIYMMDEDFDIRNEQLSSSEKEFENALRPLAFNDFSGQKQVVENLEVFVEAAKYRGEPLDHVLLHGPPGLLVGATTRSGLLTAPLRARFGINMHLQYYDPETLQKIIERSASILRVPITTDASLEIARRSRGTPRIANALLRRVRDFAQVKGTGRIDSEITKIALKALNIDQYGLDEIDNRILLTIIDKFRGGPVGITTIATAVGEDAGTVEEVYEPFLIMEGFIKRTPRGRMATELAYKHFGRNPYSGNIMEPSLFE